MSYEIIRDIPRSEKDSEYCRRLAEFGVATVSEAQNKSGVMDVGISPIQRDVSVCGVAVTVECTAPDNLMIHASLETLKPGDILVVKTPTDSKNGYFGELMAHSVIRRGAVGLVIDGGVRDTKQLRELGFPVWAKYINVIGTTKKSPGNINKPIKCGEVEVNPGDYLVADDDGIVVVKRANVQTVVKNSEERVKKERITRSRIDNGELSIDFYNLRPVLEDLGVKYSEGR